MSTKRIKKGLNKRMSHIQKLENQILETNTLYQAAHFVHINLIKLSLDKSYRPKKTKKGIKRIDFAISKSEIITGYLGGMLEDLSFMQEELESKKSRKKSK